MWTTVCIDNDAVVHRGPSVSIQTFVGAEVALAQKRAVTLNLETVDLELIQDVISGLCEASPQLPVRENLFPGIRTQSGILFPYFQLSGSVWLAYSIARLVPRRWL